MTASARGWRVSYHRGAEYEIRKCAELFNPSNESLLSVGRRRRSRRFVVVDENFHRLHSGAIRRYFADNEVDVRIVSVPAGEPNKSVEAYVSLLDALDQFPIDRRDEPIIAIGGGVITDLTGFVAGTYRRGVPHIRVPTTLMGYVDASVGIKTGVNLRGHKNRVGAFTPPARVLLDRSFLATLPRRHILNGVCEVFKLAVISDLALFEKLEAHGPDCIAAHFQDEPGLWILDRSIQRMLDELQLNLFEDELARKMDFGHTFSYGLETCADSQCLHGEAVLIDVLVSSTLAQSRGLLKRSELDRIVRLAFALDIIPPLHSLDPPALWESLLERTRHRNGWQRVPLPHGIGKCTFVNDVQQDEVRTSCVELMALSRV
jgi:3-dehydroquinate synthase